MKKFSLIALTALACWGMTSCDEYTLPNPEPQKNVQEPVFKADDLVLTNTINGTIDLPKYTESNEMVTVFDVQLTDFPASYTLQLRGEFSADETFEKTETLSINVADNVAQLRPGELQAMFNTVISKDLVEKPVYVRYAAYAIAGTSTVRLGGPDKYYWEGVYNILPNPQANLIEPAYYLVGSFCDWNISKGILLNQLHEGNQYDNPEFYLKVDVTEADITAGGYKWKVVPVSGFESNSWEGALGVADVNEGAASTSGNLVAAPDAEALAYNIDMEGSYMLNFNMETRRFEVALAFDYMWIPGYGTSIYNFDKMMRLQTNDYIHYEGTSCLYKSFWLTGQPNLRGIVYRPDGDTEITEDKLSFSGKMTIDNQSGATIKVPARGLYYLTADISALTYKGVRISSIQLIGAYNDWSTDTAKELTPTNSSQNVWKISGVEMTAGEFKFCVDKSWTYSYGGSVDDVRQNGSNFNLDEAGTYDFELHFDTTPATLTIIKK